MAATRMQKVVVPLRKRQQRPMFGDMPLDRVKTYGRILLRSIQTNLGDATFFTREDLLQLPEFTHVSTIYRYGLICTVVRHLAGQRQLTVNKRTDLCLPSHQDAYSDEPLYETYADTIRRTVTRMAKDKANKDGFSVMDIVGEWRTDPHLTTNNKRVAVRGALVRLLKAEIVKKKDEFTYVSGK